MPLKIPSTFRDVVADVTVPVHAPRDEVFDYLVDPANRPRWQSSLKGITKLVPLGERPGDVGTSWVDITVVPGVKPAMEVVKNERPHRWVETGQWAFVDAALVLRVEPAADGSTSVNARAVITVPFVLATTLLFLKIIAPPALRADLRGAAETIVADRELRARQSP
ncbi:MULTISPECIES: SRPBCC family protein [unclassified Gordonia (in: high G+C Gram-positive bacteria)]